MEIDLKKPKTEALCLNYFWEENKIFPRKFGATSDVCPGYVTMINCNDKLNVDAYLNYLNELFNEYELGVHGWELPCTYKNKLSVWEEKFKYECSFELKNPVCLGFLRSK